MTARERLAARTVGAVAVLVLLGGVGVAAWPRWSPVAAVAATSADVVPADRPATPGFTLAEVAAGTVDPVVYDRFWADELERLAGRPCGSAEAGLDVTVFVGADDAWRQRLEEAARTRGVACRAAAEPGGTSLSGP